MKLATILPALMGLHTCTIALDVPLPLNEIARDPRLHQHNSHEVDFNSKRFHHTDAKRGRALIEDYTHNDGKPDTQPIIDFVENLLECFDIGNFGLTVVHNKEVLLSTAFGTIDPHRDESPAVDVDTYFGIGSTSKAFTTTLLAMLVSEGKLQWEDRVKPLLSEEDWSLFNEEDSERVTIADLVSHMTGVPRNDFLWILNPKSDRQYDTARVKHFPANYELRQHWQYNNWMFLVAGHVVETIEGEPWEDIVKKRIFEPLGMDRTTARMKDVLEDGNYAFPNVQKKESSEGWVPLPPDVNKVLEHVGPAGSINSSPREMGEWLKFQLNEGVLPSGERLVEKDQLLETRKAHASVGVPSALSRPTFPVSYDTSDYGFAWVVGNYNGYSTVQHNGGTMGHISLVNLYPDLGHGLFQSTGADRDGKAGVMQMLVEMFVINHLTGDHQWLNVDNACTFPCAWMNCTQIQPQAQSDTNTNSQGPRVSDSPLGWSTPQEASLGMAGTWCDPGYGCMKISDKGVVTLHEMEGQLAVDGEAYTFTLVHVGEWRAGIGVLPDTPLPVQVDLTRSPNTITLGFLEPNMPPTFERVE